MCIACFSPSDRRLVLLEDGAQDYPSEDHCDGKKNRRCHNTLANTDFHLLAPSGSGFVVFVAAWTAVNRSVNCIDQTAAPVIG